MKKANIVNIYKHNIVYKNVKNIQPKRFVISLIVLIISAFGFVYMNNVNETVKSSTNVFNPISELYRDVEVASFVSGGSVNFIVPIKTEKYNVYNDCIQFEVTSSIMVYATASGVVQEVGVPRTPSISTTHKRHAP